MDFSRKNSRGSSTVIAFLCMMLSTALIVLPGSVAMADDGDLQWAVSAGGTLTEEGHGVAVLSDGGALVAGSFGFPVLDPGVTYTATFGAGEDNETTLSSAGEYDVFVARYNSDGTLAWAVDAGGTSSDEGFGIAALADDSSLVTGRFRFAATFGAGEANETDLTAPASDANLFLARYNSDGTLEWAVSAGGNDWTQGNAVAALEDGSALVTGYFEGAITFGAGEGNETSLTSAGQNDLFVAKYNSDGTLAWATQAGGTGNADGNGQGIAVLSDGSSLVTGAFWNDVTFGPGEANQTVLSSAGDWDIFVAKYDPDGNLDWAVRSGGSTSAEGEDIATLEDGSSLITGNFEGVATFGPGDPNETTLDSGDYPDILVAKYNPDGTLAWATQAGGVDYDYGRGIAALPDGRSIITGDFEGTATFGAGEPNETSLTSSANQDFFLAKYDPDGALIVARQAGGTDTDSASGNSVSALDDGTSVATGTYRGDSAGDLGGVVFGPGEDNETVLDSVVHPVDGSSYDAFAAKFDGPTVYSISGTVTLVGGTASVTDVTLTLSGDDSQAISPDEDATYSLTDLEEGAYNVTPSLSGYVFEPVERDYDPLDADMTGQDYVGTAIFDISGTVSLVSGTASVTDVTLTLSGDDSQAISPNGDGTYGFAGLEGGNYTITPVLAGYVFVPTIRSYTPLDSDMTNQDFVGTFVPPAYGISGTVTLVGGTASATDVTMVLSGNAIATVNPEGDGTYSFGALLEGQYSVTPSLAEYVFAPVSRSYAPLNSNQVDQDFVGTYTPDRFNISGTVTLVGGTASVTEVTLQVQYGVAESINPEEDGTYAFSDLPVDSYIIVPSLPGYVFEPTNRQYIPLDADQVDQDYVGTYTPGTFSISGTVTLVGGSAAPSDVLLELRGAEVPEEVYPAEDGTYAFLDVPAGSYIAIPSLEQYRFEPGNREYAPLNADQVDQDYTGFFFEEEDDEFIGHGRGGTGPTRPCFIATAAYGTPAADEISVLSDFRDRYLLTNRVGTAFVRAYYRVSPSLASFIAKHEALRAAVRAVLTPIVALAKLTLTFPLLSVMVALLASSAIGLSRARRKQKASTA